MSQRQRQRRSRVHQSTQTEDIYFADLANPKQRQHSCPELNGDGYYHEKDQLYERLLKAEEVYFTLFCFEISSLDWYIRFLAIVLLIRSQKLTLIRDSFGH